MRWRKNRCIVLACQPTILPDHDRHPRHYNRYRFKRVSDIIAEISAASQEQASGIDQVNKAVMQMDETMQQNAAMRLQ
ncbi:MAG: hypothetical protein JSS38_11120 [Nitrospira sp.]|nr:hypothetical protein [Nitrospira sp.]